ncbi:DUF4232 domain-containing protein [Streptomyces sp. JJ36]|uniref:DUF4232 domain-containing protein n=1 Tax=Streptomyces sp. JJ36 TaxID=2736645 RepID=UPI001F40141B|nr:DUF4232 domain-containing protein [Streptomyces sp. JJ36]MCF6524268.1 DUF4232 domain-containing protein [Streptomyces sp. JJ36]
MILPALRHRAPRVRPRTLSLVLAAGLAAGLASGCGLAAEIERERDPARTDSAPGEPAPEPPASAAAGAPEAPTPPPAPHAEPGRPGKPRPAVPGTCPRTGVRLHAGLVNAAMGLRGMSVTLTNCGDRPYRVAGHPRLRVLNGDGQPLDVEILRDPDEITAYDSPPVGTLVLQPGEEAVTELFWRNTVTAGDGSADTGVHLDVTPAEGDPAQRLTPDGGLDLGTTGRLATTPWHRPER